MPLHGKAAKRLASKHDSKSTELRLTLRARNCRIYTFQRVRNCQEVWKLRPREGLNMAFFVSWAACITPPNLSKTHETEKKQTTPHPHAINCCLNRYYQVKLIYRCCINIINLFNFSSTNSESARRVASGKASHGTEVCHS